MYSSRVHTRGRYCGPPQPEGGTSGEGCGGYFSYGSPQLLLSSNGTLLSFNQATKMGPSGYRNTWIDMVLRRSFDRGRTWQPLQVVHSETNASMPPSQWQTIGQDTAVLDRTTGVVHMMLARNNVELLVTSSADHGATWAPVRDITAETKPRDWGWIAPSFSGLQRANGELLLCFDYCPYYAPTPGQCRDPLVSSSKSGVFKSTDHGATWRVAAHNMTGNECAIAELANGTIVLNARNYVDGVPHVHRAMAWSHDGGESFSPTFFAPDLISPIVEGAMISATHTPSSLGVGPDPLFFTNPASSTSRRDMTLKLSVDGGVRWSEVMRIQNGSACYSSMVQFDDGTLGVQWDDARNAPISHVVLSNETFVRLELGKRPP